MFDLPFIDIHTTAVRVNFSSKQHRSGAWFWESTPCRNTAVPRWRTQMSKSKPSPMTREAVTRVTKATTTQHGGQIPAKSFVSRADAQVQREAAKRGKPAGR